MYSEILSWVGALDAWWSFGIEVALKSTLVLFVAIGIHALLSNRRPLICSAMWSATLVALVLLPLAVAVGPSWSVLPLLRNPVEHTGSNPAYAHSQTIAKDASTGLGQPIQVYQNTRISATNELETSMENLSQDSEARSLGRSLKLSVVALICLAILVTLVRLFGSLRAVHRLRSSAIPVDDVRWLEPFQRWSSQLGLSDKVSLTKSDKIQVPIVVGSLRPLVVLPDSLIEMSEPAKIEAVIAHELAHVRRHDYEWQLLLRLLQVAYCYQPLIWIAEKAISSCREEACDEFAIHAIGNTQEYVATLILMAERLVPRSNLSLGLAVVRKPQLARRLKKLSASSGNRHCRITRLNMYCLLAVGASLSCFIACLGLAQEKSFARDNSTNDTRHTVQGMASAFMATAPPNPTEHEPNLFELEVIDPKDQPVTNVEALLYRISTKNGTYEQLRTGFTDGLGRVKFSGIVEPNTVTELQQIPSSSPMRFAQRPGYLVTLRRKGLSTVRVYFSAFDLAIGGVRQKVRLRPAAALTGRITDSQGEPVEGALVTTGSWAGTMSIEGDNAVRTDSEGRYKFLDLVSFSALASQAELSNSLSLQTSASKETNSNSSRGQHIVDAANGKDVSNLVVFHPDYSVANANGGDVPGTRNLQLVPSAVIVGRVVRYGSGTPQKGIPIIAISRQSQSNGPSGGTTPSPVSLHSASTVSDNEGRYHLANLPAGKYDVWAQPTSRKWQDVDWVSHGQSNIEAEPNETTQADDIAIGPGGVIRGQLLNFSTGNPIRFNAPLPTIRPHIQLVDGPSMQYQIMQNVPVTAEGTFEIRSIPGNFRCLLFVFVEQDGLQGEKGSSSVAYQSPDYATRSGPVLEVMHGQTIEKEFHVMPEAEIIELRASSQMAFQLDSEKKWNEAIAIYSEILKTHPLDRSIQYGLARARFNSGKFSAALVDFNLLVSSNSKDPVLAVYLADLLATSPSGEDRNGLRAVKLATSAVSYVRSNSTGERELSWALSVQAAAYAEVGQFDKAVATQQEAISLAKSNRKEELKERLSLYMAKTPYRRKLAN